MSVVVRMAGDVTIRLGDPRDSLVDRDPTPEDIEAERDKPRPGVWAGEPGADLRALTQEHTDMLIRTELVLSVPRGPEREALVTACGGRAALSPMGLGDALCQRGGIDSDPLVRVLARRAWGDRDRCTWSNLFRMRADGPPDVMPPWSDAADDAPDRDI